MQFNFSALFIITFRENEMTIIDGQDTMKFYIYIVYIYKTKKLK